MSDEPRRTQVPLLSLCLFALLSVLAASPTTAATVTEFPGEQSDADEGSRSNEDESKEDHGAAPRRASVRKQRRSVMGDLNSQWGHVGGGAGYVVDPLTRQGSVAGRFTLGGGGYTIGLYGGGGVEVTGSALTTPSLSGVGFFGVAIPVPVVHPMVGLRGHVGLHPKLAAFSPGSSGFGAPAPHVGAGLQAGFIIRQFDGRPGLRLMLDAGAEYRPDEGTIRPDIFVTLAAVF
jgi:hypothetical protein